MPAKSKAQQKYFGMMLAVKRGEIPISQMPKNMQKRARQMMKSMSEAKMMEYAGTPTKKLPNRVKPAKAKRSEINKLVKKAFKVKRYG